MCRTIMKNNHFICAGKHKSRQKHKNWNDCKFSWVVQSGTISFSKFTFHFNSSPTISLLARLHRYKSLIIQTYELNSKQKHKFLVTHLISTPHKLFHISRECILEVSTRLHKISQCPEGNFTRLGPFPCWKCLIKTNVVRAFPGHHKIYRSPFDTSTYCLSEKVYLNGNSEWKCEWPNFFPVLISKLNIFWIRNPKWYPERTFYIVHWCEWAFKDQLV